jgi:hypothetical protein
MMRAGAAWNNWRQQIPPDAIVDPNNRWDLAGQNENDGQVVGYSGKSYLWVDARWQFNVSGLYQLPLDINFAVNFFGREGYPQSYYVRSRQSEVGARTRNLIDQIDSYRLSNVYQLDFRLEKTFNIGPVALTALAELFNVTNNNAVLQRVGRVGDWDFNAEGTEDDPSFIPNGEFNQIFEVQSPRILRVGARISF